MSKRVIIPYNTEETATAWSESIGDYVDGQLTGTVEQLTELASQMDVKLVEGEPHIVQEIADHTGVVFDRIVVVDVKHLDVLADKAYHALNDNGCDSSWYSACKEYNHYLVTVADFNLPI